MHSKCNSYKISAINKLTNIGLTWTAILTAMHLAYHSGSITRGNIYKLTNQRFHYDLRKHYFSARTVNVWYSLRNHVVDVTNVNLLKAPLDRFWMNQDVEYDFSTDLSGTGDRSEYPRYEKYVKHSFYIVC